MVAGYQNFNTAAKKLDRRLQALGATAVLPKGLADEQQPGGYDAALDPWLMQLWTVIRQQAALPAKPAQVLQHP